MIVVSFFSADNVLSDEVKICYIFEFQSNKNQAFRFFGTPGILPLYGENDGRSNSYGIPGNPTLEPFRQEMMD